MCCGTFSLVRTLNVVINVEVTERESMGLSFSVWLPRIYIVLLYTHSRSYLELETTVIKCRITLTMVAFVDGRSPTFHMINFCGSSIIIM